MNWEKCQLFIESIINKYKVTPTLGGVYNGSITFIDSENKDNYIWYTVQLDIDRPAPTKKVEICTQIRKAVLFETQLTNPENTEIVFEVMTHGEGLIGEQMFSVPPLSTRTYLKIILDMN